MKQYSQQDTNFGACKLNLDDLRKLVNIVIEGFPSGTNDPRSRVTTNVSLYQKDFSIVEPTLEEFLRHDGFPDKLDKLTVEIMDWEANRTARINFDPSFVMLFVSGRDETWVLGKYERIRKFLEQKRPWFWPFLKLFTKIAAVIYIVSAAVAYYFYRTQAQIFFLTTLIFLVAFTALVVYHDQNSLLPHTQIILNRRKTFLNKETITIIIALLSLIVTVIGLFLRK